ncbi:MAG: TonB-dependent receptor domain-containing protein [Salibacteraceae bacterium]
MQTLNKYLFLLGLLLLPSVLLAASLTGVVKDGETGEKLFGAEVLLQNTFFKATTDENGRFVFKGVPEGKHVLQVYLFGFAAYQQEVIMTNEDQTIETVLNPLQQSLDEVVVEAEKDNSFGITRLRAIEGTAIYASKKNEVVVLEDLNANLAQNNGRQVYARVAGLNIWESDPGGLQLGVGGRGLSPNRTSNFNTRQNGYDISADPLGYPESYYTPPTEAVRRIEVVRGAASLQYGPQFGGMINFSLKEGPRDKPIEVVTRQTVGSFGFFNSFNSVGGTHGKINYYGYLQYKQGDGWRPNSNFESTSGYGALRYKANKRMELVFEFTHLNYLAKQPGGLTDAQFERDAQQSNRERNWFAIDWNIASATVNYNLTEKTRINSRFFGLSAKREALGNLDRIDRADDPTANRDLIYGDFNNFGNETRFIHQYRIKGLNAALLTGVRYFQGQTVSQQGEADNGSNASFNFINPDGWLQSDYEFPSRNIAFFAEHLFTLAPRWTLTPGFRFEYLYSEANGYYRQTNLHPLTGEILLDVLNEETNSRTRSFFLGGLGTSYRPLESVEVYGNFSQNYRPINFNDIRIINPNQVVDPNIKDERGFSLDLGFRGNVKRALNFDVSFFMLAYKDRIGTFLTTVPDPALIERVVRLRTNIANSRSIGVEAFGELDLWRVVRGDSAKSSLALFVNVSHVNARYISSDEAAFDGRKVELVPEYTTRSGLTFRRKNWSLSYQFSWIAEQFSDATNAEFYPTAVAGIIPAYHVSDLSGFYRWKRFRVEAGINNLTDERYFTRRATGYPGPGILPSEARSFYTTLQITI